MKKQLSLAITALALTGLAAQAAEVSGTSTAQTKSSTLNKIIENSSLRYTGIIEDQVGGPDAVWKNRINYSVKTGANQSVGYTARFKVQATKAFGNNEYIANEEHRINYSFGNVVNTKSFNLALVPTVTLPTDAGDSAAKRTGGIFLDVPMSYDTSNIVAGTSVSNLVRVAANLYHGAGNGKNVAGYAILNPGVNYTLNDTVSFGADYYYEGDLLRGKSLDFTNNNVASIHDITAGVNFNVTKGLSVRPHLTLNAKDVQAKTSTLKLEVVGAIF